MKKYILFAMIMVCCISLFGQRNAEEEIPLESVASETNLNKNSFPRIMPDLSVLFRIKAPNATKLQVDLGKKYDMERGDNGIWTLRTEPQVPGFHYYSLIVDGVMVSDPMTETFFGSGGFRSAIEVPEAGLEYLQVQNVPHGEVRTLKYYSNYMKIWREINIYTPPSYNSDCDKKYPVVYIQHGGGEDHRAWVHQGRLATILDNLIAEGKAEPMIVVCSNSNIAGSAPAGYNWKAMQPFNEELMGSIIPFVDANYRTMADSKHRAMCGLSMGGGQSLYIGLHNLDVFSAIGIFSTGVFGGIGGAATKDLDSEIPGLLSSSRTFNEKLDVFMITCGEQDMRIDYTKKAVDQMRENGLNVVFESFPGDHEWQVWRKSFRSFAMLIFK